MGQIVVIAGLAGFLLAWFVAVLVASARRDALSIRSREFWTGEDR